MATTSGMELSVELEKTSSILRKMKVKVPAKIVKNYFEKGLVNVQKTANLKGFRPGQAPISIIKQYYGEDVRHRVLHSLIDDSFAQAVREQDLKTVGSPKIDTPQHKTGEGAHDHTLHEDQDLNFEATFEILPEVQVKGYTGIAVTRDEVNVTDEHVAKVVDNLHQSQGQLSPVEDGARPVQKGDFVDTQIVGGLVTESGVQAREDMKGNKLVEVGSAGWIPGFDDHLIGMRRGEEKTFRMTLPKNFNPAELSEKEVEFTVIANELKEKKLPALDDEFAKQMGYESLEDIRTKARDYLVKEQTEESERKVRSDLLSKMIEKNPFEVPLALVEGQTRALAQEWGEELKNQGFKEDMIRETIMKELEFLRKRAESQVRSSLILESVAKEEKIEVSSEELDAEIDRLSGVMKVEKPKLEDYYAKNPGRKGDLEFRLRQERTIKFLLDKAKIKSVAASEK